MLILYCNLDQMCRFPVISLFTCINVATAAIALWWAKVRVSTSGLAQAVTSLLLFVLVTMTSGLPLLAAASAAAFAALAAALALARAAFRAWALIINTAAFPEVKKQQSVTVKKV